MSASDEFRLADRLRAVQKSAIRRLHDSAPRGSINLGLGEPDFSTPDVVRAEAERAIREGPTGYTSNAGLEELRHRIADYHNEGGSLSGLSAGSICVTNGSAEALFALVLSIVGPGDEVLLPDPGYVAYPTLVELAGGRSRFYRLPASNRFGFDRSEFESALTERTRLVFVLSPSNPTGRVIDADDLKFIADRVSTTGACLVADEIYRELYFTPDRPRSISEFSSQVLIVSGLSKSMSMTGWRIGWVAGRADLVDRITVLHQYISTCASTISQRAAIAAFSNEGREATRSMREELARRREILLHEIDSRLGLECIVGEGAFYAMLDVSAYGSSEEVAGKLLSARVIAIPGSAFGEEGEGFLRLSFSVSPDLIREGISRIAAALRI